MHAFPNDSQPENPHLAMISTNPLPEIPLVRIHSECCTGDVFSSMRCDCGEQLQQAMELIGRQGGILIYLRQEGRGIGLLDKLRAYKMQEEGLDTVEANEKLGHPADGRKYQIAADILISLRIQHIHLLTNNPAKIEAMSAAGIEVTSRIPLITPTHEDNARYMQIKKSKLGHLLD
jgi:3,4-dihydroxy 2-butanone 4-phosphate synthase/GTP cyclohydrolase II